MGFLTSWSFRRFPALLGLDLSDDSLRVVELQQRGSTLLLCTAGIEALPAGAVVDGDIQQFDAVVAVLDQWMQRHPVRTRDVAMALPTAAVRLDSWEAPLGMNDEALALFVADQVAQRWAVEPDDVSMDYGYAVDDMPCPAGLGQVWVAAAPLEMVQDRQGLAQACDLRLTDLESHAQASKRVWQLPFPSVGGVVPTDAVPPPFEGMRLGPKLAPRGWPSEAPHYSTACGLALRRFMS